jgi:hypothetical protein
MPQEKHGSHQHAQPNKLVENEQKNTGAAKNPNTPKTESSSEYEGASDRENTGNRAVEEKTETSSSSGQ